MVLNSNYQSYLLIEWSSFEYARHVSAVLCLLIITNGTKKNQEHNQKSTFLDKSLINQQFPNEVKTFSVSFSNEQTYEIHLLE